MKTAEKPKDLITQLKAINTFAPIKESALAWMADQSDYVIYDTGELVFKPNIEVMKMKIILEGEYQVRLEQNGTNNILGTWGKGNITGILPFSRMKVATASGVALSPVHALEFPKEKFTEMVNVSYSLVQQLVANMSDRIRDFSHLRYQNEKLMSLGKLSAGLAHELNNPAAAMVRSADELYRSIHKTPEKFKAIMAMDITPEQTDEINTIMYDKLKNFHPDRFSLMEREERLDDIQDWLDEQGIEAAEDIADTFTEFNMEVQDLEKVGEILGGKNLDNILWWLESTLDLEKLVGEIKSAADRISELVGSIKSYSHMDRSVDMELVDIHDGIKNTIIMLKHKFKKKNITIEKIFDNSLPTIKAFPSQLNQVWTNLIDNAIDAMEREGHIKIITSKIGELINIKVIDNGVGIPIDIQERIFDPFYTTKEIGKGTGLGLDIVHRIVTHHKGDIKVSSIPGETTFSISLPLN